jgi:hypothetical protein
MHRVLERSGSSSLPVNLSARFHGVLALNAKLRCEIMSSPAEHATCVDISRRGAIQGLNNPHKSPILAKHSRA